MEDEGGFLILGLTVFTAVASLIAIVAELATAKLVKGVAQGGAYRAGRLDGVPVLDVHADDVRAALRP